MHIGIHHNINDTQKWNQGMQRMMSKIEGNSLPAGMKPVCFIPATNHKTAFCVWEGDSLDSVRKFVDQETGGARNDYFEVETESAMGLPSLALESK